MSDTPSVFVTGATGQLGRLVIDALLETVPAGAIVAGVRDASAQAATALRERGVALRIADYSRPETLADAFVGIDRLLLISGNEIGQRVAQHRNVIDAAKASGVGLIAYTSILRADSSPLFLAREHLETEIALAESGVPFVLLRNGWYNEVYTWRLPLALKDGALIGSAAGGRISSAGRADYARAAAVVLAGGDHAGRIYELAGDTAFTLDDLAALVTEISGTPVSYHDMPANDFHAVALAAGVPEIFARILSDTDAGVAKGALFDDGGTLARLIGGPTIALRATVEDFLASLAGSPASHHAG